ncbi:hypothetical protein K4S31_12100 [Staphylococcus epidermidis]|nr:hypothetical protein [Staphylococcus epidermidis]MCG2405769.1 hypothetical protein [Staphylococcus epidermidis]
MKKIILSIVTMFLIFSYVSVANAGVVTSDNKSKSVETESTKSNIKDKKDNLTKNSSKIDKAIKQTINSVPDLSNTEKSNLTKKITTQSLINYMSKSNDKSFESVTKKWLKNNKVNNELSDYIYQTINGMIK